MAGQDRWRHSANVSSSSLGMRGFRTPSNSPLSQILQGCDFRMVYFWLGIKRRLYLELLRKLGAKACNAGAKGEGARVIKCPRLRNEATQLCLMTLGVFGPLDHRFAAYGFRAETKTGNAGQRLWCAGRGSWRCHRQERLHSSPPISAFHSFPARFTPPILCTNLWYP